VSLYLPDGHPSGIERKNLVIKAGPAGLVLGDELGFESGVAIARHFNRQFAEFALEYRPAFAIAGVAGGISNRLASGVAQVLGHLGLQPSFHQGFGEMLEQPVLANQVFRFLVI